MRNKFFFLILIIIFSTETTFAQEILNLNSAIQLAVKNNYSIGLAADSLAISKNNNTYGNAGALPSVFANGGFSIADNNISQHIATSNTSKSGVISKTYVYSAGINWTLFNGFKPFATKGRLNLLQHQGELNIKIQVENLIVQVTKAYFNLIRAKQALRVTLETISIDDERIKIADTKFTIGSGNKLDLLQAKVDRNQQESLILAQRIGIDSAKIFLNQLLVRDLKTLFEPMDTSITITYQPRWENLLDSAGRNNYLLKAAATNIRIGEFFVKERRADLFPVLQGIAAYYFSQNINNAGFALLNKTSGPQLGLQINWNIFNGRVSRIKLENAKINLDRVAINYKSQYSLLLSNLLAQFISFQNDMVALHLEDENVILARENLNIALTKYRLGGSTQLELMTAEQSLESSLNRLVGARYKAKLGEINLLQLSGNLIH